MIELLEPQLLWIQNIRNARLNCQGGTRHSFPVDMKWLSNYQPTSTREDPSNVMVIGTGPDPTMLSPHYTAPYMHPSVSASYFTSVMDHEKLARIKNKQMQPPFTQDSIFVYSKCRNILLAFGLTLFGKGITWTGKHYNWPLPNSSAKFFPSPYLTCYQFPQVMTCPASWTFQCPIGRMVDGGE